MKKGGRCRHWSSRADAAEGPRKTDRYRVPVLSSSPGQLRVGIFTDDFYPESGGVGRSIELQVAQLAALGHQVTLFAPNLHFTPPTAATWEPLDAWHLPGSPSFLCSLQVGRRIARRIAATHDLDVVHSQNERGSIFLAAQVASELGVPHVHTFHSNYVGTHHTTPVASGLNSLTYLPLAGRLMRLVTSTGREIAVGTPSTPPAEDDPVFASWDWRSLARLARHVDAFTSPARFMVDSIVDASRGALSARGFVVETGVAAPFLRAERRRPRDETIRFISCGRLGVEKRVDALIRAFAQLDCDNAELAIIGTGPAEASLRQLAKTVRRGTVSFLGHYDSVDHLAQEIADADVFVLASYHFDTQGMVLAEAAAAGTPILYCDERLHVGIGSDNAVLAQHSVDGLADAMRALVAEPDRLPIMAAASKDVGRTLTAERMASRYVEIYRSVIERR